MQYSAILMRVESLPFVENEQKADAMIKSVLGHLASRMNEEEAKQFTKDLPKPLGINELRGHQINVTTISLDQFVSDLKEQFKISTDQVQSLIRAVLHIVKEDTPSDHLKHWQEGLPSEWASMLENA
ncbi:MAG: DUF2267 domain-containing protein [Chitinispirillaceae bacterium]